jgi:hypothetical protein
MNPETYTELPPDVRDDLPPVTLDRAIPAGAVDVYSQGGATRMLVNAFVRVRRKARKAERRNKRRGQR